VGKDQYRTFDTAPESLVSRRKDCEVVEQEVEQTKSINIGTIEDIIIQGSFEYQ